MLVFASVWQARRLICRFLTQLSRNKIDKDTCCSFEETTIYNHIFIYNIQLSTQIIPIYTPKKQVRVHFCYEMMTCFDYSRNFRRCFAFQATIHSQWIEDDSVITEEFSNDATDAGKLKGRSIEYYHLLYFLKLTKRKIHFQCRSLW